MQFNPEALRQLLEQDDVALWKALRRIAAENGIALPERQPSPADMQKLRQTLKGASQKSVEEAASLIHTYKRGRNPS
ncbi:MAG: hypothetical protein J6K61_02910 [Clostridia bacterium]|nr:hypothetical protein [Clostridia bacterium]